ncbi:MAG: TatD family hydrolase [Tannerella sp.]|jgi:TatD DNase family protein|nr:TatD family hydrolase [Tannerella sp.]
MQIIDTHTHIYAEQFDDDRKETITRAKETGITALVLPNEDSRSLNALKNICKTEPDYAFPMAGLHPTSVKSDWRKEISHIEAFMSDVKCYGIGEIGLDYYWDKTYIAEQRAAFEYQLKLSAELNLPVSIHTREAFNDAVSIINNVGADSLRGIFHCFGGNVDDWEKISTLSTFYVGIGGVVTFKNSPLRETIKRIPLDRIVVETDAPYLAPTPYRGKRNEPAYIRKIISEISALVGSEESAILSVFYQNAQKIFNLPVKMG